MVGVTHGEVIGASSGGIRAWAHREHADEEEQQEPWEPGEMLWHEPLEQGCSWDSETAADNGSTILTSQELVVVSYACGSDTEVNMVAFASKTGSEEWARSWQEGDVPSLVRVDQFGLPSNKPHAASLIAQGSFGADRVDIDVQGKPDTSMWDNIRKRESIFSLRLKADALRSKRAGAGGAAGAEAATRPARARLGRGVPGLDACAGQAADRAAVPHRLHDSGGVETAALARLVRAGLCAAVETGDGSASPEWSATGPDTAPASSPPCIAETEESPVPAPSGRGPPSTHRPDTAEPASPSPASSSDGTRPQSPPEAGQSR